MLSKDLFPFLKDLESNNNREWFETQKFRFATVDASFKSSMQMLFEKMNNHDIIDNLKTYRIYRDVRFSKDKTPFKTHRSANWSRAGLERRGGYYLRVKPNESMIGIGFFDPNKEDLLRIRKEFEFDAKAFRDITERKSFKKTWGNLQGDQLKTAPRDFDKTHADIDLIRFKNFYFSKTFTDKEVLEENFLDIVNDHFKSARPFLDYMSQVLTTNLNGESII